MSREYIASKEIQIVNKGFYKILNIYKETKILQQGEDKINLYGLFLSDLPADGNHGNEIHFPLLFAQRDRAEILYSCINHEFDIHKFEEMFDNLTYLL